MQQDNGKLHITASEAKSASCLRYHHYKYRMGIRPRRTKRPLKLGDWIHTCLENYYQEMSWHGSLEDLIRTEWNVIFEEERVLLGNIPEDTKRIMESYEYYYKQEVWEPLLPPETKFEIEVKVGKWILVFTGRVDLIVKDLSGHVWCVDHKSTKTIPEIDSFRAMDPQLTLYPFAIEKQYGIKCDGTIYNYIRTKVPTTPKLLKSGLLSARKIDTDILTFRKALKTYDLDPLDYKEELNKAKRNTSKFFFRARVPRDPITTRNVLKDLAAAAIDLKQYVYPRRTITRNCEQCEYLDLCQTELFGHDTTEVLQHFVHELPYAYLDK